MRHEDYNYNDEMAVVASHCKHFIRNREDVNYFSMETYQSCENCRNFTTDYKCRLNKANDILFHMNWE